MTSTRAMDEVLGGFAQARGVAADEEWAAVVVTRTLIRDVNQDVVREGLREALDVVRQSQESPEELFGDPREWADVKVEEWRAEGAPVEQAEPDTSWREVPVVTMVTGTIISLLLLVLLLVQGRWRLDFTWGTLLLPTISALATLGALTLFERVLQHARRLVAAAAGLVVVAVGVAVLATLFYLGQDQPVFRGSVWWFAAIAAGHAVLAWVLAKVVPDRPQSHADRTATTDDEWERQVAGILRLRVELPEGRVRQHLEEAKAHAAQSGRSLHEEFGAPNSYASRFPRDRGSAERRRLWLYTAVVPVSAYLAFGEVVVSGGDWSLVSWPFVLVLALVIWATVSGWLAVARRRPGGQDESLSTSSARP